MKRCRLHLFGLELPTAPPSESLESRLKSFMRTGQRTECLDDPQFRNVPTDGGIADYLLNHRAIIAELKSLTTDPSPALSRKASEAFQAGGLLGYGATGLSAAFKKLQNGDEVLHRFVKVAGRRVRENLQSAGSQIAATKEVLKIPSAAGIAIIANENIRLIEASILAKAIQDAFVFRDGPTQNIDYVWVVQESQKIRLPNGNLGYPMMFVVDADTPAQDKNLKFIASMLDYWFEWSGSEAHYIEHDGRWDALQPVWEKGETPSIPINWRPHPNAR